MIDLRLESVTDSPLIPQRALPTVVVFGLAGTDSEAHLGVSPRPLSGEEQLQAKPERG